MAAKKKVTKKTAKKAPAKKTAAKKKAPAKKQSSSAEPEQIPVVELKVFGKSWWALLTSPLDAVCYMQVEVAQAKLSKKDFADFVKRYGITLAVWDSLEALRAEGERTVLILNGEIKA